MAQPGTSRRSVKNTRGASLLSYGLIVGLISVVALATVANTGSSVNSLFGDVDTTLDTVITTGQGPAVENPAPTAAATPNPSPIVITGSGSAADPFLWANGARAPSCYDYLNNPPTDHDAGTADGVYELDISGSIIATECDQTTDGGGWTLVGKGRQGWTWSDSGQGTVAELATDPDTNSVAALSSAQVQTLLGTNWNSSVDGMRLDRFAHFSDTFRVTPNYTTAFNWSEFLDCRHTSACSHSNTQTGTFTRNGGAPYTADFADTYYPSFTNDCSRVFTAAWGTRAEIMSFSAGHTCSDGNNLCWEYSGEAHCVPRSKVYVRQ